MERAGMSSKVLQGKGIRCGCGGVCLEGGTNTPMLPFYMDSDSIVHVGPKSKTFIDQYLAYSAQIWEEKVDEVVKNSNCLLIRCQPKTLLVL